MRVERRCAHLGEREEARRQTALSDIGRTIGVSRDRRHLTQTVASRSASTRFDSRPTVARKRRHTALTRALAARKTLHTELEVQEDSPYVANCTNDRACSSCASSVAIAARAASACTVVILVSALLSCDRRRLASCSNSLHHCANTTAASRSADVVTMHRLRHHRSHRRKHMHNITYAYNNTLIYHSLPHAPRAHLSLVRIFRFLAKSRRLCSR
jgi:hypothetical protein